MDPGRLLDPTSDERRSFGDAFERLVGLMARLRAPEGCPWDRAQTLESLRSFLLEETHEVLEAIDTGSVTDHLEELGDLLLQVVFQSEIRRSEGAFDAADVAGAIADKLVRRHPHVFGDQAADTSTDAFARWESMKRREKIGRSALDGVPPELPALLRAQRVGEKASRVGFDFRHVDGPLEKLREEMSELEEAVRAGDAREVEREFGDILFTMVNVARFMNIGAEDALRGASRRFEARFRAMERRVHESGKDIADYSDDALDALWREAKRELRDEEAAAGASP